MTATSTHAWTHYRRVGEEDRSEVTPMTTQPTEPTRPDPDLDPDLDPQPEETPQPKRPRS
jgi:hypothetical protein